MQNYFETIDRFFSENKPKEAERFMLAECKKAEAEGRDADVLNLLNELIGYYRQTSMAKELEQVISHAMNLAERMGLKGTVNYATTALNAATGYRSIGKLQQAKAHYEITKAIYDSLIAQGELSPNDMLVAGLYNNMSLLAQEMQDFKTAEEYQLMSLRIATLHQAGYEMASSYANLANTYVLGRDFEKAKEYAKKAINLFQARGSQDPHYSAALSALALAYRETGEVTKAKDIFMKALQIVEQTIGKNSQYERLKESIRECEKKEGSRRMTGMELARKYYEEYGSKMISDQFPEYKGKIAVGLVGEGSDCYGYDDSFSGDHDFGPGFCMWLSDETFDAIGEKLSLAYQKLPTVFAGYTRTETAMGQGRRGVWRISAFYKQFIGTDRYDEIDFSKVNDYALAACTNGEVFCDEEGIFSKLRNELKAGYPADVRLRKIAEDVAGFSQCGQYNYERMKKRGDEVTAGMMLSDFSRYAMSLYHHFLNKYPPHDKWLYKSTSLLAGGEQITALLREIVHKAANKEPVELILEDVEKVAKLFADAMYASGEISDTDPYLGHHVQELLFKSSIVLLDKETLVDRIARLEFEAFDKVQNEGGRASCQNNWPTFSVMRKSQYLTWNHEMLLQYLYDFTREYEKGHNLITEKYGRMMESTDKERYEEIKDHFPALSEEKKAVIEQIVKIQMQMVEAFAKEHPLVAGNARNLHSYEDDMFDTSYETYLRGEISTYSDKMLQLYGQFVVQTALAGGNIAYETIENTARLYGFRNMEDFEKGV